MSNISNDEEDDFTSYTEYKIGVYIWKIIPPILILFGTVGNILSIIVLTRRSIRTSTTALYLTVLAFSDLVVLYSGLFRQWLIYLFEEDVRHLSEAGCKIHIWLVYSSLDFSAWILIAVTIERVISAWLPHQAKAACTKKAAIALMISIGVFMLGLNSHLLYGLVFLETLDDYGNVIEVTKCVEIDDDYTVFFNIKWPWIDLCAFCVIPFTVIVVGNAMILFKVLQSQKKAKSRIVPSITTGNGQRQAQSSHQNKQSSMTAILFTLNIVFLFSTSPVSIYNIGYTHWETHANAYELAQLDLWWAVVNMLMYTNNSLNFLLYCLSGTKFRKEVIRLFFSSINTRQQQQTNYTRTHFDAPSPSRIVNPEKIKASQNSTNVLQVSAENTTQLNIHDPIATITNIGGQSTSGYSGSNLHPNAALILTGKSNVLRDTDDHELCLVTASSSEL